MLEAHLHATGDNDDASSSATIAASCVAECCSLLNGIMESWDAVVTSYPEHPAPIHYAKAVRTASIIIADDLAPFETEWLTKTLLFKPVYLFETIKSKEKRKNEEWVKYIADSFKLLSKLVECYWDALENYNQELVELCSLSFDAQTRKEAILCLLKVLKRPSVVLTDEFVVNVISAFTSAKDCKAPLAELIGALCKYFPEMVSTENRYEVIWKKYLGTLKTDNGLTNALLVSLLRGVDDLLTTFGEHLNIEELESFYRDASVSAQKKYTLKAFEVLISILKHHGGLFQRVLVGDTAIRNYLWTVDKMYAMEALIKIYQVILPLMDANNARDVISSEIKPRIATGSVLVKHTALKVMMQATAGQPGEEMVLSSGIDLEYQLRTKRVDYDEAATIAWCIESNLANSGNMLLTAIMFYDNLPTNRKRDIVVNGIFKASDDVRKAALVLLLNLSVQEGLDKYIDVWRRILDNSTGPDLGKAVMIFKEIVHHILRDLANTLGNEEKSYTDVKPILSVLGVILSLQQTEHSTPKWCHSIIPSLVHLAMFYRQEPVGMIQQTAGDEMPYEEVFKDGTVYKTLLTIMTTDRQAVCDGTLSSFHGIFSKEGVDYKVLTKILANLTAVIEENSSSLDRRQLSLVINQIERLKYKIVLDSKDARTFQKDVIIFLAKYGQMCLQGSFSEDIYTLKLKDKVYFDIPNILQGFTLKIDLQRILQLCLSRGETDALYCLLLILTASLRDRPDPGLQEATIRVIHEIFRTTSGKSETDIDVYPALFMCNTTACVQSIIKGITEELNPQVRRKLSEHLQVVLTQDPGSETAGELLNVVAEHTSFIIARDKDTISLPDLDILRAFLQSILDNNALITEYLPKIIIYTSTKRDATDMFEKASDLITEKIDLFTEDQILELIKKLIESYSLNLLNTELIIKNVVNFIKRVFEIKRIAPKNIIDISLSMLPALTVISPQFSHLVTLLVYLNRTFEFDNGLRRMLVEFENWKILEQLSMMEIFEENSMNAGFLFLCEFADQLLEFSTEKTYKCLGLLIQNVTPQIIITLKNNITKCLSVYQRKQALIPIKENIQNWFTKNYNIDELTSLIEKWFKWFNPEELIDDIEKRESFANFTKDVSVKIHALKIFTEYFEFEFDAKNLTLISIENIHAKDELSKIFLFDLLSVCERKLSAEDFSLLLGKENDFLKEYVGVYFKRVVGKPYVVREDQCHILIDVMNYFVSVFDRNCYQDVLDFINYLWPALQNSSNFEGKLSVLTNVLSLPETVDLACPPVAWAETLLSAEESSLEDKIKILSALPAGQQFSSLYRSFASNLPVRVSEMQANEKFVPAFRALLDSLAINGDKTLLDIVLTLAKGDETKGWWDHAFAACMKSLAAKEDIEIFDVVYKTAVGRTMNFSNRILLPLLRHTSRKFLENFLCTIINDLLSTLKTVVKGSSQSEDYKRRLIQYAITFNILKIAFYKLSSAQLEKGVLNERAGSPKPWHFLQTVCCYCMAVRDAVKQSENPSEASDDLKSTYLWFHTSYYNCLSAALCRRQLTKKFSAKLFDVHAWDDLVDKQAVYPFHLKSYVRSRDSVRPARRALDSLATTSSFTGTLRSAIFLNTLSDNPLYYDLIPNEEEQDEEEESTLEFEDSILNAHGCLSTMTYLLEHVSRLEYHEWRESVVSALSDGDVHINVKWMIAQAICNASEELKPHATALCPALLELIACTARSTNDSEHRVLNNLHIDILTTIIKWDLKDLVPPPNVTKCTHYLIYTCLENQSQYCIHKRLLDTLNGLLKLYGQHIRVDWNLFQDCSQDLQKSPILPILERLLKNGALYGVSDLLSAIFALDAKDWLNNGTKLYEVTGLALSRERNSAFTEYLDKFWRILASVRRNGNVGSYVKMLYYAQKSCPQCCDADNLRIITGIAAAKIEKAKCLAIISTYLEHSSVDNFAHITDLIGLKELFDSEFRVEAMKIARNGLKCADSRLKSEILNGLEHNCQSSSVPVRKEAFNVFLKAFQDLVKPESTEAEAPAAKRIALDNSPILSIIDSANSLDREVVKMVSDGMFDRDLVVAREVCDGVQECLSEDLEMRFAELFYIIVYQRSLTENNSHFSTYGSKLIEMLFSGLRHKDTFKQLKLSNKGLSPSIHTGFGNSAIPQTMSIRTVLRSGLTYRSRWNKAPEKRQIDLEMPITDIIEVFIKVSKINSQICQELCVQIMKCLAQTGGSRFDLGSVMAKYLSDIIKKPFCLTPLVLEACRIFINDISIERFLESVKCLKQTVHNSEGYLYTNVLFEDLLIRCGDESLIAFGFDSGDHDVTMNEGFTMEGLIQAFGSLSNWEDLRIQDKERVQDSLPVLWTSSEEFTVSLRNYFEKNKNSLDYSLWFHKMLASYYADDVTQNKLSWLKHIEKWPKNDFVASSIIEAIEWDNNDMKTFGDITRNDCLVEWSARLMIRSSFYNQLESDSDCPARLSKQELLWCREANDRGLHSLALQCIDRNKQHNVPQEDVLPWFLEKVKAYRGLGLKNNDLGMLEKALNAAETHSQSVTSYSSVETDILLQKVILDLHHDLNSLSKSTLDAIIQEVNTRIEGISDSPLYNSLATALQSVYDTALACYDDMWIDNDVTTQNELLLAMAAIIDKVLNLDLATDCNILLAIPLNRLAHSDVTRLSDITTKALLKQIYRVFPRLDFCSIAILKNIVSVLPATVVNENYWSRLQDAELETCKQYFQLICDVNYALLSYCSDLIKNVSNEEKFNIIFKKMKNQIFDNQYAGTDYLSLSTLKNKLYALENMDDNDAKENVLKLISKELAPKTCRAALKTALRLSQLCPDLCSPVILESKRMPLQRLLCLPPNVHVVKFNEQVTVYTDSIRRPCVITALLSNGQRRQYICKAGEPMLRDASIQRAVSALPLLTPLFRGRSYNVTPLGEDSAIIEYLEDHVRLRALTGVDISADTDDDKLIMEPQKALKQFQDNSAKVTPYKLRSAIESNSSCVQEFIAKKRTFEDTLGSMTILTWLFGVGDRHLNNIMYNTRDGGVCAVDWGTIFDYGLRELPPARLTANLLAVCDLKVLESRLQQMLLYLRKNKKIFKAFLKTSFYWLGPEFNELKYIKEILRGETVSYVVTRERLEESAVKNKEAYIALLDRVFQNFTSKDTYSAEEQVSYLLQHCRDPNILSVTRSGWEPWI